MPNSDPPPATRPGATVADAAIASAAPARLSLVLGGSRSGKSAYAEALLAPLAGERLYIATAEAGDAEMTARIAAHRRRRGEAWTTLEQPLDLAPALAAHCRPHRAVLVDCLTLWLSNLLAAGRDVETEVAALTELLPRLEGHTVFVANEVGLGIVPDNPLGRRFRDEAGRLNQAVAARADTVVFMAAGLPLVLKNGANSP